jgi:hypothetical protein
MNNFMVKIKSVILSEGEKSRSLFSKSSTAPQPKDLVPNGLAISQSNHVLSYQSNPVLPHVRWNSSPPLPVLHVPPA